MPPRPKDTTPAVAEPSRPSVFRETGNVHARLPLHCLEPFPDNPKKPISGKYKAGLEANLEEFGICDVLKVWPDPRSTGRYYVLDGNQRLGVLRDRAEAELGLADIADDAPDRDARLSEIRAKANAFEVDCLILAELDRDRASVFNAAFDRNHALYDEAKVADLHERLTARREELSEELAVKREALAKRLGKILRPDKPFHPPAFAPSSAVTPSPSPLPIDASASPSPPAEDDPWGPPPADHDPSPRERPSVSGQPRESLVPFVLALTPASHARLDDGLFRCKARGIREKRVVEAVEAFAAALAEARDEGDGLAQAFIEMALRVLNDRIAILKAEESDE